MTDMAILYKCIGGMFVLVASSGLGIHYGEELKSYLNQLEELKKMFCLMKRELEYVKIPFAELFEKLELKVSSPFREWVGLLREKLESREQGIFIEIWYNTIEETLKTSKLKTEDLEELKGVGKNLEYIDNLNLYIEQLEYKICQLRQVYHTKRKLSRTLGVMGGIFLVILLL